MSSSIPSDIKHPPKLWFNRRWNQNNLGDHVMRIFRGMGFFDSWGNPRDSDTGSAVAFQRIADAHHVLLDPEKRKAFDEGKGIPGIPTSNDSHFAGNQVVFQKGLVFAVFVWDKNYTIFSRNTQIIIHHPKSKSSIPIWDDDPQFPIGHMDTMCSLLWLQDEAGWRPSSSSSSSPSPYHHITISPYHHITISPYHHITISPYHHITIIAYLTFRSYHLRYNCGMLGGFWQGVISPKGQ